MKDVYPSIRPERCQEGKQGSAQRAKAAKSHGQRGREGRERERRQEGKIGMGQKAGKKCYAQAVEVVGQRGARHKHQTERKGKRQTVSRPPWGHGEMPDA